MKVFLMTFAMILIGCGVIWVAYGVMIGLGSMGSGADASNKVLAAAIPSCAVMCIAGAIIIVLAARMRP